MSDFRAKTPSKVSPPGVGGLFHETNHRCSGRTRSVCGLLRVCGILSMRDRNVARELVEGTGPAAQAIANFRGPDLTRDAALHHPVHEARGVRSGVAASAQGQTERGAHSAGTWSQLLAQRRRCVRPLPPAEKNASVPEAPIAGVQNVREAPMTDSPPQQLPSLREATRTWAKVAALSFGGPAGQIAVMHRILVDEKKRVRRAARLRVPKEFRSLPRLRNSGG